MVDDLRVGIVTVTYNSAEVIRDFLSSIRHQTYTNFILYAVDNASSDDTLVRLSEDKDARLMVLSQEINVGVAEGNNIGIRAALKDNCELVLLINNDTVFDSELLSGMIAGLVDYKCDMIVPKVLYFDQPMKLWCAGGYFNRVRASARHFGMDRPDDGSFDLARVVTYSPTCCMLIKRSAFSRIGFMDPNYFVYFDDTDFCHRAHRAGLKLFYLPTVRLLHKVSSLTKCDSDFYYFYTIRNHIYYILKHFPRWQIFLFFPAYQLHIAAKFLVWLRQPRVFVLAEKAFWKGIVLFLDSSRQKNTYDCALPSRIEV
jgi:GT2 family glycosyltransferase